MYLTREEEKIYDGELGWAYEISMRILVKLGDIFGATRLIPIESAHISGVSYKTMGDAPIDFLEALVEGGGKAKATSTVNPSSFDYKYLNYMPVSHVIQEKQIKIIDLYKKMGVNPVLTCTPYYIEKPKPGSHLAWAESSAVVYANSVLGSWTNREGSPSALASALIGKTPNYGIHQPMNRRANFLVKVQTPLENETDFGALGIHLGKVLKDKVPVFEGLLKPEEVDLKQMGAAMATTGMVSIFHLCYSCRKREENLETLTVESKELKETFESLSTTSENPDMVFIGCPHCSFDEIRRVAEMIRGKRVKEDVKLWVCTSCYVREKAKEYVDIIENAGGKVISDTCAVVTWIKELGVETLMTNSAKTAYYAPALNNVKVTFAPLSLCINTACRR
ncbi:MAG: aconitase X catalytic domain-containing protein [Candidatus Bathyarchaeia archaeon]